MTLLDQRYIQELSNGKFRDCTAEEVHEAKIKRAQIDIMRSQINDLQKQIDAIIKNCKHPVNYDKDSSPYFVRRCIICGASSLI